jgi:hypothetical protein
VYPDVGPVPQSDLFLRITRCSLCHCGFPKFDIVIANCPHLYHPWCAQAVYRITGKYANAKCRALVDLDWHRSFGWTIKDLQMQEKADMYNFEDEKRRLLTDKAAKVQAEYPTIGKLCRASNSFSFLYMNRFFNSLKYIMLVRFCVWPS